MLTEPRFWHCLQSRTALGRIGKLRDVMGAVLFLCSGAAALVTASALMVDGRMETTLERERGFRECLAAAGLHMAWLPKHVCCWTSSIGPAGRAARCSRPAEGGTGWCQVHCPTTACC